MKFSGKHFFSKCEQTADVQCTETDVYLGPYQKSMMELLVIIITV